MTGQVLTSTYQITSAIEAESLRIKLPDGTAIWRLHD